MIPESKCASLEIFADPPVDYGVKSELNNAGYLLFVPCVLGRDFSVIPFLVTRANGNYTILISSANSCNIVCHDAKPDLVYRFGAD
jgi:hypothetical protein